MNDDLDIKIAGNHPSRDIAKQEIDSSADMAQIRADGTIEKAHMLGEMMAKKLLEKDGEAAFGSDGREDMLQRRNLLSFTVTIGFERFCKSRNVSAAAYGAFFEYVKKVDPEIYLEMSDTGVFSFYYLAYRRGIEIERRIGQTFAMLCGKDGNPIYQELGEALYCRFSAVVEDAVREQGL